ncbi:MAG: hypothetical protein Q7K57_07200 [Burkholderiaceae bacterium]|nr:hypothetical protein [Burkholderiaceae bacterium]
MTPKQLPPTFCWTKMGTESGEDLSHIVLRKEWERRLGEGRFLWGIGQSLGTNADVAAAGGKPLAAVFSPMPSKPKAIDVTPADVVLWNSWIDTSGNVQPLPRHSFVTSRATLPSGRRKECHYALVCRSSVELGAASTLRVSPLVLRNLSTGKALGASQVTAVVAHSPQESALSARSYPVSFVVELEAPFFVRLANPTLLKRRDIDCAAEMVKTGDMDGWATLVTSLRSPLPTSKPHGHTRDMFQALTPFCDGILGGAGIPAFA